MSNQKIDELISVLENMQYQILECQPNCNSSNHSSMIPFMIQYLQDESISSQTTSTKVNHAYQSLSYLLHDSKRFREKVNVIYTFLIFSNKLENSISHSNVLEIIRTIQTREKWKSNYLIEETCEDSIRDKEITLDVLVSILRIYISCNIMLEWASDWIKQSLSEDMMNDIQNLFNPTFRISTKKLKKLVNRDRIEKWSVMKYERYTEDDVNDWYKLLISTIDSLDDVTMISMDEMSTLLIKACL